MGYLNNHNRERNFNTGIIIKDPSPTYFMRPNLDRDDQRSDPDAMKNKNKTRYKSRYQRLHEDPKPKIDPAKVISAVYQYEERRFVIVYEDNNGAIVPLKISRDEFYRTFSPNDIAIMNQMNSLTERDDAERLRRNDHARRRMFADMEIERLRMKVFQPDPIVPKTETLNKIIDEDIRKAKAHVEKKEEEVITWDDDDFVKPISTYYERKSRPWWKKIFNIQA